MLENRLSRVQLSHNIRMNSQSGIVEHMNETGELLSHIDSERVPAWAAALRATLAEMPLRIWPDRGDPEQIRYALLWKPPPELFDGLVKKTKEMGLFGLGIPPEYGGPDVDIMTRTLIALEYSQHRAGMYAPCYGAFGGVGLAQLYEATEAQKEKYLYPTLRGEKKAFFGYVIVFCQCLFKNKIKYNHRLCQNLVLVSILTIFLLFR